MSTQNTVATKDLTVRRLARNTSPAALVGTKQNFTVKLTFVYGGQTGTTKVVNGKTWYECFGTYSFDNPSIEIAYGNTANIKIKTDHNASSNGWKIVTFIPKSTNPAGGPVQTNADANGDVEFDDNNTVAGSYYYGLYLECPSNDYYSSYDPVIVQDGGGTPPK